MKVRQVMSRFSVQGGAALRVHVSVYVSPSEGQDTQANLPCDSGFAL